VAYYLRGEEYTAQIDAFVNAVEARTAMHENSFASAFEADRVIAMIASEGQDRK
jgi:hypothetical protein